MLPTTGFPTLKLYTPDAGQHFVMKRFMICPEEAEAPAVQSETLIPEGARDLLYSKTSQTGSAPQPATYSIGIGVLSRGYNSRGERLATHLHLVPRLRMSGAIPLLLLYPLMEWTQTT